MRDSKHIRYNLDDY
jgi:hypothetical protein